MDATLSWDSWLDGVRTLLTSWHTAIWSGYIVGTLCNGDKALCPAVVDINISQSQLSSFKQIDITSITSAKVV